LIALVWILLESFSHDRPKPGWQVVAQWVRSGVDDDGQEFLKRASINKLGNEVLSSFELSGIVHSQNVGMIERRR